jgi:hypothetical protein
MINMNQEFSVFFSNFVAFLKTKFKTQEPIIATIIQKVYSLILAEDIGVDGSSVVKTRINKKGYTIG